jgi:hypothetical protein
MRFYQKIGIAAAIAVSCLGAIPADAQLIVRVRPRAPRVVVTRPPAPSPRHVWIQEDWRVNRGRYDYAGGRWEAPPDARSVWVPGHWKHTPRRGWVWKPGHWRIR